MRIISGTLGGRRIATPTNMPRRVLWPILPKVDYLIFYETKSVFRISKHLTFLVVPAVLATNWHPIAASDLTIIEKDAHMHAFIKKIFVP